MVLNWKGSWTRKDGREARRPETPCPRECVNVENNSVPFLCANFRDQLSSQLRRQYEKDIDFNAYCRVIADGTACVVMQEGGAATIQVE